jgi:hypothetical protein
MRRSDRALAVLSARGVVAPSCVPVYVFGDAREVLASIDDMLARSRDLARTRKAGQPCDGP